MPVGDLGKLEQFVMHCIWHSDSGGSGKYLHRYWRLLSSLVDIQWKSISEELRAENSSLSVRTFRATSRTPSVYIYTYVSKA